VQARAALAASEAIDFVCHGEFDFTIQEVAEGARSVRSGGSAIETARVVAGDAAAPADREHGHACLRGPVYARDLTVENYYIGYLLHPTSRSIPARLPFQVTFCCGTDGGRPALSKRGRGPRHRRDRGWRGATSPGEGVFFDDDTFTDDLRGPRRSRAGSAGSASRGPATPRRMCRAPRSKS